MWKRVFWHPDYLQRMEWIVLQRKTAGPGTRIQFGWQEQAPRERVGTETESNSW
jgi:hypothetical protein